MSKNRDRPVLNHVIQRPVDLGSDSIILRSQEHPRTIWLSADQAILTHLGATCKSGSDDGPDHGSHDRHSTKLWVPPPGVQLHVFRGGLPRRLVPSATVSPIGCIMRALRAVKAIPIVGLHPTTVSPLPSGRICVTSCHPADFVEFKCRPR
jgi:hypothetical protein